MMTWWRELARSHESNPSQTVENIHGCSQSDQVGIGLANISRQLYVTVVIEVTASTIDGVSTPPGNLSVMQFALESPAVIGPVPPPVGRSGCRGSGRGGGGGGLGVADGLLEGEEVGDDDGLPLGEGLLLADALPLGEGLLLGDGLGPAVAPLVADLPWPSCLSAPLARGRPGCLHGPLGQPGFLVISHEPGVPWGIPEFAVLP